MTRHVIISVEQLIEHALEGKPFTKTMTEVDGGHRTTEETKIHFKEDREDVHRLMVEENELIARKYPEVQRMLKMFHRK